MLLSALAEDAAMPAGVERILRLARAGPMRAVIGRHQPGMNGTSRPKSIHERASRWYCLQCQAAACTHHPDRRTVRDRTLSRHPTTRFTLHSNPVYTSAPASPARRGVATRPTRRRSRPLSPGVPSGTSSRFTDLRPDQPLVVSKSPSPTSGRESPPVRPRAEAPITANAPVRAQCSQEPSPGEPESGS
jgi:hypothetical protein